MEIQNDLTALYEEAARELRASNDAKLEDLKWRITRAQVYEHSITPALLAKLFNETPEWGTASFAALRTGGFIQHSLSQFGWVRLDPDSAAHYFDILAAIEAVVSLRCRYLDLRPVLPRLKMHLRAIDRHAKANDVFEVCLNAQRLFLVLVAAVDAPDLFRDYAAIAKASMVYAWCASLDENAAASVSTSMRTLVKALADHDGVTAARTATFLRGMPSATGNPLIPMSC
ncbi:hypothetical protein [Novosphingobium sp. HII-3]|uniref:hypothetical protein n=1 Tax=Novosphingobium sp. HII-3 TaxID=2075565 RepID=UPI000CDB7E6E|nr:hypothetical protein [Novosphingobium sp. HII-3]